MLRSLPLLAGLLALSASAAVVMDLSDEELVARSDVVVRGTVLETRAEKSADGAQIFTRAVIRVDEPLKGAPGATVTVTVPGGEIDGIGQSVPGAPTFRAGEEVVVMLHRRKGPRGWYGVEGLGRGKFTVTQTERGKVAVPQIEQIELVHRTPGGKLERVPGERLPRPLDELLAKLRGAAAREKKP